MSVSVDVSLSCDGKVNGKRCRSWLSEDDDIYCASCAGQDRQHGYAGGDETLRTWMHDNGLSLTSDQYAFLEQVCESLCAGRPISLVSAVAS